MSYKIRTRIRSRPKRCHRRKYLIVGRVIPPPEQSGSARLRARKVTQVDPNVPHLGILLEIAGLDLMRSLPRQSTCTACTRSRSEVKSRTGPELSCLSCSTLKPPLKLGVAGLLSSQRET